MELISGSILNKHKVGTAYQEHNKLILVLAGSARATCASVVNRTYAKTLSFLLFLRVLCVLCGLFFPHSA